MAKDYYFQHDHNPTTDPKVQAMISEYGDWGYGLFWRIVEMLHRESDNSVLLKKYVYASFAQHKSTSVEQVAKFIDDCINEFELFQSDGICFWSDRVKRNMGKREEIRELRSKAGKASAEKRERERLQNSTHVEHVLTDAEQNSTKEKKGNESKVNETSILLLPSAEKKNGSHAEIDPFKIEQLNKFHEFEKWIVDNAPQVAKMKEPFTLEQWQKATAEFGKLGPTLKNMHNYKPLLTKNVSAYLTLCNWARRDREKQSA